MINEPKDRILVALDYDNAADAVALAQKLTGMIGGVKVGLELVNAAGFDIFDKLRDAGIERIFYDAKFHDIPNTVAGAVRAAAKRGVWMVNVHASGGIEMLKAASEAAQSADTPPLLIGVTVLTSLDDHLLKDTLKTRCTVEELVENLCYRCESAGLDGVVASPLELGMIQARFPQLITVIPGIRPAGVGVQDQKRVATPAAAVAAGAHYLVIGRAITGASDPRAAAEAIADSLLP